MQTAMDEVSHHEGNVWRPIISLPREDAERLGYDHVEAWQNLIKSSLIDIAEGYKIKPVLCCGRTRRQAAKPCRILLR